ADKWSGDTLIDPTEFAAFKRGRDYSERNVLAFARKQKIAPGIVVGRMQREGMIKYSVLNDLKVQYEIVA
ncbi:XRE family transcriptional regulator, partial [bacterium]|nr:XRE family transcriptional regulator [bacterium]